MEAEIQNPSQLYRFCIDGVHETNIIEWSKKRKLQSDQLDFLRPKHKCWIGDSSSEHALSFDENPALDSMQIYVLKGRTTDAEISESESVKDRNSLSEDNHSPLDESAIDKECSGEADSSVDKECNPSYHYADLQALKNLEEQILEIESRRSRMNAKESTEESIDMEFEHLFPIGENHNTHVLSPGRRNVKQEAQSSTRPTTIDQEFEQYFSMLML